MAATSITAPTFEHSTSISAVPIAPALLMSLAASHKPLSASAGNSSMSARSRCAGAPVDAFQNGCGSS